MCAQTTGESKLKIVKHKYVMVIGLEKQEVIGIGLKKHIVHP